MRLERLVIEAGERTFTLDLHPRLTVVAGMGPQERSSLIGEVLGALSGSRDGVHVEIEERGGRHLAVFRPLLGRHRVVDVDRAVDVTDELCGASGACNLLERLGLDPAKAASAMRFSPGDLTTSSDRGKAIEVLARLDQRRVWAAASTLRTAEGELAAEALQRGSAPEDAALMDLVETRHVEMERAVDRFESTRKRTFAISGLAALATVPGVIMAGLTGLAFIGLAGVSVAASFRARRMMLTASDAEGHALAEAGAQSYLGFQLQRVNSLIGDDSGRRTLMGVAGSRRTALAEWQQLAGDIPVKWALSQRLEIEAVAHLRRNADALSAVAPDLAGQADDADALAQALITRLAEARSVAGEGVPLLLDDPLHLLEPALKLRLLELLGRSAGEPQLVFLTDDPAVADWARSEAMTGDVVLIEPATGSTADSQIEGVSITL